MSRVHLFVHGRGQGHATRCLAVGRGLEAAGFSVAFSAGRDAAPVLRDVFETHEVSSLPPRVGPALVGLGRRVAQSVRHLRTDRPDVVVSDGDLPGAVAARTLGIPVIAIGHGLTFVACRPPPGVDKMAWAREAAKAWVASAPAAQLVAVNFVPLQVRRGDAVLARPALELPAREPAVPGKVVCYFRDAPVPAVFEGLLALGKMPVSYGREDPGIPGVPHRPRDRASFLADLKEAEAVVASAGSQLISECVELGVPFFGVHAPGDDEQALNVAMLRGAGLGDGCAADAFEVAALERALARPVAAASWPGPGVVEVVVGLVRALV